MAAKPNGTRFAVGEQIFDDRITGISFQFFAEPRVLTAPFRLRLFGNVPYSDHEFVFDADGIIRDRSVVFSSRRRPSWLRDLKF
jgi:hypothetical protein